jgi:hypothetical protein|eukprot:m.313638 g.313638  ORF g.313638 m.313638 type:complete len:208 (+) comp27487_c0_seq1:71-694(+)
MIVGPVVFKGKEADDGEDEDELHQHTRPLTTLTCLVAHLVTHSLTFADSCIDDALSGIRSEESTATHEADRKAIHGLVQSKPGGFSQLDSIVRAHLHRWFESQGAVKSGARIMKNQRPAKVVHSRSNNRVHPDYSDSQHTEYSGSQHTEYSGGSLRPEYTRHRTPTATIGGREIDPPIVDGDNITLFNMHSKSPFYFHSSGGVEVTD